MSRNCFSDHKPGYSRSSKACNGPGSSIDVRKMSPHVIIAMGMIVAFAVFLFLEICEHLLLPTLPENVVRVLGFIRGFLATAGGMIFVCWFMSCKERELVRLRDHFSEQLAVRTDELVSAGKQLEGERRRLDAILQCMGEGVVEIDEDGAIHSVNRRAVEILGMDHCDLIRLDVGILASRFTTAGSHATADLGQAVRSRASNCRGEARLSRSDGSEVFVVWTAAPISTGDRCLGSVITLADVTERFSMERAIMEQREDFISALKHKLMTPVLAGRRAIALLLDGAVGQFTEEQVGILRLSLENGDNLKRLVGDLVEIYRYQNGMKELNLRRHAASAIVTALIDKFANRASSKEIALETADAPGDAYLDCDKLEIVSCVGELLANAIEHARSRVRLVIDASDDQIIFAVADDGRGIDSEDVRKLFERFYEASANGRYSAVTGTGLCLCNQIARAHGGRLLCESIPGTGTTFKVFLPVSPRPQTAV